MTMKSAIISGISLEDIQCFITIAELKSFTEAAVMLYTTQPQLSKKISVLESRIGARLFDRSKRQIKLTPAGEQLYAELEPQVRRIEESFERIRRMYREHSNVLRICCDERIHAIEDFLFPSLFRFQQKNPKVIIELESYNLPALKNKLLQKETDILLSSFPEAPVQSKGIQWVELKRVQMYVTVRADHQYAYRRVVTWSELKNEILLLRASRIAYEYYDFVLEESKKNGFSANIQTYANERSIMLNIEFGNGICIGSEYDFSKDNKLIRSIPITDHYDHIYVGLREDCDRVERLFLQNLVESCKE